MYYLLQGSEDKKISGKAEAAAELADRCRARET